MVSGEQLLWDAHLARVRRRALAPLFDPVWNARTMLAAARAGRTLGTAFAEAAQAMARFAEAYKASQPSAMDELRLRLGKRPRGG